MKLSYLYVCMSVCLCLCLSLSLSLSLSSFLDFHLSTTIIKIKDNKLHAKGYAANW